MEPVNIQKRANEGIAEINPPKVQINPEGIIQFPDGRRFRVKQVKIQGQAIDFQNLKPHDQQFKSQIEAQVGKSLKKFNIDEIKRDEGSYKLSLTKEKVTLKTEKDGQVTENTKQLTPDQIQKQETQLTNINQMGLAILQKPLIDVRKHTFTKDVPSHLRATAIKVGVTFASIIFAPILVPLLLVVGGAAYLGVAIHNAIQKKYNLVDASKEMKITEEKNKFDALKQISKNFRADRPNFIDEVKNQNTDAVKLLITSQNKVERHILRFLANNGTSIDKQKMIKIRDIALTFNPEDFIDTKSLEIAIKKAVPELGYSITEAQVSTIVDELKLTGTRDKKVIEEDIQKLENLIETLETTPPNFGIANTKVTAELRAVIQSQTYQALKEDPDNEYVKLTHKLACGIWNNVKSLSAYEAFADQVLPDIEQMVDRNPHEIMKESHGRTKLEHFTDHGIPAKILYAIINPAQAIGSLASLGGWHRELAGAIPFIGNRVYDSHGELHNNPSLQGTTTAAIRSGNTTVNAKINNCYGGSPTINDQIAPEFEALCQAAENNQFANEPDNFIPSMISYTNFQNIENRHGEGERSFAIMFGNKKYPLSFLGMTLAKDSGFYKMGGKYKNGEWTNVEDVKWNGAKHFGQKLIEKYTHDKCFQYGERTVGESANGMFFPGTKEEWKPIFAAITKQANLRFQDMPAKGVEAAKLRGAYQEYVYTMIQQASEIKLAQDIYKRTGNPNPLITAIRACKENIDRGGAENAKYLYVNLPENMDIEERMTLVTAALECRALSARERVILEDRLPSVLAFIEKFKTTQDRIDIKQDILDVAKAMGVTFEVTDEPTHFIPALDAPKNPVSELIKPEDPDWEDINEDGFNPFDTNFHL